MENKFNLKFKCIGFDTRIWPWGGAFNTDETGWEINENRNEEIKSKFDVIENAFQLINIENSKKFKMIREYVLKNSDCNLVSISVMQDIVDLFYEKIKSSPPNNYLNIDDWKFRGYDICDINGLFSVLHHPKIIKSRDGNQLFGENEVVDALQMVQFANLLEPQHMPFVVAKIHTLK